MNTDMPEFGEHTNCAGAPLDVFFSEHGKANVFRWDEAREICAGCPLLARCFEYAITTDEKGFWGGAAQHERKRVRQILGVKPVSMAESLAETQPGLFGQDRRETLLASGAARRAEWAEVPLEDALATFEKVCKDNEESRTRLREAARVNGAINCKARRKLSDEDVLAIRASSETVTAVWWAKHLDMSESFIRSVRRGRRYADVGSAA